MAVKLSSKMKLLETAADICQRVFRAKNPSTVLWAAEMLEEYGDAKEFEEALKKIKAHVDPVFADIVSDESIIDFCDWVLDDE